VLHTEATQLQRRHKQLHERWSSDCRRAGSKLHAVDPDLSTLCLLLSGDDATLQARAETWSQLLCAVLLYQQPLADGAKLYQFMRTCKAAKGENDAQYSDMQRALLQAADYAMQGDIGSLIQVQLVVSTYSSTSAACTVAIAV
jgi:Nup85 Nucleoporin